MQLKSHNPFPQTLDRIAIAVSGILIILIVILLWSGDRTAPQVREFTWQNRVATAKDTAFIMTFNRPMHHESVEANLKFAPALPGKFSWAGRRMAYTLSQPARYGQTYRVQLQNAFDRFAKEAGDRIAIEPFQSSFTTPDPAFAYIGDRGEARGRLVTYDLKTQKQQILSPEGLFVTDFRIYPDRRKILFAAAPLLANGKTINILEQKLYTVTLSNAPHIETILDADAYQNFKFDLSADGKTIVVQRLNRLIPGRFGLWTIRAGQLEPLDNKPGGDFLIAPDSASVAVAQGEGVAILALEPHAQPYDFLAKFGMVLHFSNDGTQAAMVKFNKDYTRSLFRVDNQGQQQELLKTKGSILSARFAPQAKTLYCLLTDLQESATVFQEEPYLAAIDLESGRLTRMLDLTGQRNIQFSIAPDGSSLLLDSGSGQNAAELEGGDRRLRMLSLDSSPQEQPNEMKISGFHPQWLP